MAPKSPSGIQVCNHYSGKTLMYCLPLVIGTVHKERDGWIKVTNTSTGESVNWPVVKGKFKALVELQEGSNRINIQGFNELPLELTLIYQLSEIQRYVQPIYIKCCDDPGCFQAPSGVPNSSINAQNRILLGAKLIQTFTAEKLREHGFGEMTFKLGTDENRQPFCHVFTTNLSLKQAHSMDGGQLWNHFAQELISSKEFKDKENCKWYAFMSFTRYNIPDDTEIPQKHQDILKYTKGHTALGGGGLALFGTGNLHTWAETISELVKCFTDTKKIDRNNLMDDSGYRQFYWANYATGLGASLHELGHTFDLAHTPTGIMARGFDDIHKVYTIKGADKVIKTKHECSTKPSSASTDKQPAVDIVFVEKSFQESPLSTTMTVITEHYDGSTSLQSFTENRDGSVTSSKSVSSSLMSLSDSVSTDISAVSSPEKDFPSELPNSTCAADYSDDKVKQVVFRDGKAHWYRSSAILLRFHKWFNPNNPEINHTIPTFESGQLISQNGLRLIELRTVPAGVVVHHWEFLNQNPPKRFTLEKAEIQNLFDDTDEECTVLTEDNFGNILRKKIFLKDLIN